MQVKNCCLVCFVHYAMAAVVQVHDAALLHFPLNCKGELETMTDLVRVRGIR